MACMGLNPFRGGDQRTSKADIAMVVGAIAATVAVIVWAFVG